MLVYTNFYKYSHRNGCSFLLIGLLSPKSKQNRIYSFKWVLNGEVWVGLTKKITEEKNSVILFPWQVEVQRCYSSTYCSHLLDSNSSQIIAQLHQWWNLTNSLYFQIFKFIFLNSIPTLCSLQTWRKCICFGKS